MFHSQTWKFSPFFAPLTYLYEKATLYRFSIWFPHFLKFLLCVYVFDIFCSLPLLFGGGDHNFS
jgi:hypothetical protein